jgi:DNA-binding MarR family transcriptional regulator
MDDGAMDDVPEPPPEVQERLGRRIALTAKALHAHLDEQLGRAGGSLPSWIALDVLTHADAISQRHLAELMHVESPTLTHHLDRWEADGLVERQRDPADRRVVRVRITEAGRLLHRELAALADESDARLKALMTPAERRTLEDLLDRVRQHATLPEEAHVQ